MTASEAKIAVERSNMSEAARQFWQGTTEQNEFITIAQRDGIDAAVQAIEEVAK